MTEPGKTKPLQSFQIERAQKLIPEVQKIADQNQKIYMLLYYLTWTVSFLTAGIGATILTQVSTNQDWGKLAQGATALIAFLQTLIKIFALEDRKNTAKQLVLISTDLRTRLESCVEEMSEILSDGIIDEKEGPIWTRITVFIASTGDLLLSLRMGEDLREKISKLQKMESELQQDGITGLYPADSLKKEK
jgi:hypothetical protein